MHDNNPSLVLREVNQLSFEERPIPVVEANEVLIEMRKTGICGTDVHYLTEGRVGNFVLTNPIVLGHEPSGVISQVGDDVKDLAIGLRVALEPGSMCMKCHQCRSGKYELCPNLKFAANPPYNGTLGRFFKLPRHLVHPLPHNLTLEDGAMIEPLAVAVHAVICIGGIKAGQTVAVFGAGPIGLLCMVVAKACGASRIIAVDQDTGRLAFAKSYAATDTFQAPWLGYGETKMEFSRRAADSMHEDLGITEEGPEAINLVIEASGAETCAQTGVFVTQAGGTFVQVGMGTTEIQIPITLILVKELSIKGSLRFGPGDYETAIRLVANGQIDMKPLVTHRFAFKDAVKAFEATKKGLGPDGKRVIKAIISAPDIDPDHH